MKTFILIQILIHIYLFIFLIINVNAETIKKIENMKKQNMIKNMYSDRPTGSYRDTIPNENMFLLNKILSLENKITEIEKLLAEHINKSH